MVFKYSQRIEVYGSNLAGRNGKGHALFCKKYFDAIDGVGEGISGNSYALPTKDENLEVRSLKEIDESLERFYQYSLDNPHLNFFLGKIGTGLAGYSYKEIVPLVSKYNFASNVVLPGAWDHIINKNNEIRLILAGGRDFNDYELLSQETDIALKPALSKGFVPKIISGTANGADKLGEKYAKERGYKVIQFPAPWSEFKEKFGSPVAAGFVRNQFMAQYSHALLAFHDGKSKGTKNMINIAKNFGLKQKTISYHNNLQLDI